VRGGASTAERNRLLVGREAERGLVDALLSALREGEGSTLILEGEPGIGKTALLRYGEAQAKSLKRLSARGVESEMELPFSGLAAVARPILSYCECIPDPQAAALRSALALGPPVAADLFTTAAATMSLLAAAAEDEPILVVIDDVHWLDAASARCLIFAARRLRGEAVAFLIATRPGNYGFDASCLQVKTVPPLETASAERLLEAQGAMAAEVREAILASAEGNPLAIVEIPQLLTAEQLLGRAALSDPLPPGRPITETFAAVTRQLPPARRRALLIAAAASPQRSDLTRAALPLLGLRATELDAAEEVGIIEQGSELRFRHPLLRSVLYHGAARAERREAHRALAAVSEEGSAERAWHLALAASGPDDDAANALSEAADEARARNAHEAAGRATEHAARLTRDEHERDRRLIAAAKDFQLAAQVERAEQLLVEAAAGPSDAALHAEIQLLRGRGRLLHGSPVDASALLQSEAEHFAKDVPAQSSLMLAEATAALTIAGQVDEAVIAAKRSLELAERSRDQVAEFVATLTLAEALNLRGETVRSDELFARCDELPLATEPLGASMLQQARANWFFIVGEHEKARTAIGALIAAARARNAPALLPFPLASLAEADFRAGRWIAAYAEATEALALAEETHETIHIAFVLTIMARLEALRGAAAESRGHIERARSIQARLGCDAILVYAKAILALLELSLGNFEAAIVHGERVADLVAARGLREPGVVHWQPDLIEAYIRTGKLVEAEKALGEFEEVARQTQRLWALATAARCRGLLPNNGSFEDCFRESLSWHDKLASPFERARTELVLGERRRRAGHRSAARSPLQTALGTFEELGAVPWVERARRELRAAGQHLRPRPEETGVEKLTPQELQVAVVVAGGATNREAAEELFLSPKTIEFHLGHVYGKLQVRSRTELARLLAAGVARSGAEPQVASS
jgi:ATP/maltotriose-dependent transcriptional regulator MalT